LFVGIALAAALGAVSACAGTEEADTSASTTAPAAQAAAPPAQPEPTPPAQSTTYTDAQLHAFAAAAVEIDPITRTLPTATPEQRAQATEQIRAILARNNIDADTYNAIAAQAQSDPALAARIRALHESAPAQ
jgi:hypothetical protein